MLEFLISLICVGLCSILFFVFSFSVLSKILGVTKAVFLVSCVISLIINFCIDWDTSFFTILLGALCGLVVCYLYVIGNVDVCPECGAWNAYKLVDKRNIKQEKGVKSFHNKRAIYDDTGRDIIANIDEGYEQRECLITYYEVVYKCQKCGAERIINKEDISAI